MPGYQSKKLIAKSRQDQILEIDGLTKEDCVLLDRMWAFDDYEDLMAWQEKLRPALRQRVDDLMKLVLLAHFDREMENQQYKREDPYPDANEYLKRFRL